jgi:hypothetical protein
VENHLIKKTTEVPFRSSHFEKKLRGGGKGEMVTPPKNTYEI